MSKLEDLKRLAASRTRGELVDPPAWSPLSADRELIEVIYDNIDKLLAVVEAAKGVSVFLQDRWCEDHAYRSKHLQPLVDVLAALEDG